MLPESLPASSFLDLVYRADLSLLVARWQRQPTPEELRAGYLDILEAAAVKQCARWLLDVRGRADSNATHTTWMMDEFFPLLPTRFARQVFMAYLFAPNHLLDLEADTTVPPLSYFDDKPYRVRRFTEEAAAVQWLEQVTETLSAGSA